MAVAATRQMTTAGFASSCSTGVRPSSGTLASAPNEKSVVNVRFAHLRTRGVDGAKRCGVRGGG